MVDDSPCGRCVPDHVEGTASAADKATATVTCLIMLEPSRFSACGSMLTPGQGFSAGGGPSQSHEPSIFMMASAGTAFEASRWQSNFHTKNVFSFAE